MCSSGREPNTTEVKISYQHDFIMMYSKLQPASLEGTLLLPLIEGMQQYFSQNFQSQGVFCFFFLALSQSNGLLQADCNSKAASYKSFSDYTGERAREREGGREERREREGKVGNFSISILLYIRVFWGMVSFFYSQDIPL